MKRFLCSVLLLFFISLTLYSRVITIKEAEKVALIWIQIENNSPELRTTKKNITFSNLSELIYMGEKIGYVIGLLPKGFMIIPAFTELSPVKFISYSENYERLKDHPFIETIKDRLYYAQCRLGYNTIEPQWKISFADIVKDKIDIDQKEKNEAIWTNFLLGDIRSISASTQLMTAVAPLLTSRWDQENPYYIYTPMIGNVHCLTGCSATAAAQVMNYWKYPTSGQGVHSYYWNAGNSTVSADINHDYNWNNMLNSYNGSETQEQIDAVARLMSDIGISFQSQYSLTASGAWIDNEPFVYFFKYSPEIAYVRKINYATWNDWFNVFKSQLDKNWPALLSVYPRAGGAGHVVAIDGYRVENNISQVHANLGWGGAYDNYYSMDDIYGWGSEEDMATINIHPPICNNTGGISGKITDLNGISLKNVHILIYTNRADPKYHEQTAGNAWTDNNGYFKAECINPGNYFVYYDPSEAGNYCGKWYNDKEPYNMADIVVVTAGQITSGIDAHLGAACTITGRVVNYEGVPVPACNVSLSSSSSQYEIKIVQSNSDGYYLLSNITSGDYKIFFFPYDCIPNYAFEWFNDKSSFETAEIISVNNGQTVSGIDARLELGGIISGRVTDLNGQGIQSIDVRLYDINHSRMESELDQTDINGNIRIARIRSGSYKIYYDSSYVQNKYASEWYNNKNSFKEADVLNVAENQTISIITQLSAPIRRIGLSKTSLSFGSVLGRASTSDQAVIISNTGTGTLNWTAASDKGWLSVMPGSGTGTGGIQISVNPTGLTAGTQTGTITISDPNATNSPQTISATLTVKAAWTSTVPFGYFDTPIDGTISVTGAIPVAGWVLDDIETTKVEIKRDPVGADPPGAIGPDGLVYIGDVIFVEGARPDVETAYPSYPLNYRAGWGYMMLTNFLPNQGNGTFKIHAFAYDKEGNKTLLGTKTVTCSNATAVKPFGTIDTPAQGGDVSGTTYVNFGWVLTPQPNEVPKDGSTISAWVDGVQVGVLKDAPNAYNQYRSDIAGLFPGLKNSGGPVGFVYLNTTLYSNGVHTIYWIASDDAGHADGIGSRYFNVMNTGTPSPQGNQANQAIDLNGLESYQTAMNLPTSFETRRVKRGFDLIAEAEAIQPDQYGVIHIDLREVERVELDLKPSLGEMRADRGKSEYFGFLVIGNNLRPLPIGSTLGQRNGTFSWLPGPGFLGEYHFLFLRKDKTGGQLRMRYDVKIIPKFNIN